MGINTGLGKGERISAHTRRRARPLLCSCLSSICAALARKQASPRYLSIFSPRSWGSGESPTPSSRIVRRCALVQGPNLLTVHCGLRRRRRVNRGGSTPDVEASLVLNTEYTIACELGCRYGPPPIIPPPDPGKVLLLLLLAPDQTLF